LIISTRTNPAYQSCDDDGGNDTRGRDRTENDLLRAQCHELEKIVKSLRTELRIKKFLFWQMKRQIRIDYEWDGESDKNESLSLFVQRKMKMEQVDEYVGLWERVICPTIQMKYVTIRCNLNKEV
jgi:hypothetical protein